MNKDQYKNLSYEQVKQKIEDSVWQALYDKDSKDDYYKETRFADGSIHIQSNHLDIIGGSGFAKQFDKAMKESINTGTSYTHTESIDNKIVIKNIDINK